MSTAGSAPSPEPFTVRADDGYPLHGFLFQAEGEPPAGRAVAVINCATSVRCRYYFRFAGYLASHGIDVLVYDYRGIGVSRPPRLAGFAASWLDWGRLDCEAVLRHAMARFPGRPVDLVAHSVGGFVLGLAPASARLRRVFTVGAQYAHWRDYARDRRLGMLWKWHVVMPALAALCGYFPAARLGWMEDTPRGVALSWSRSRPRFEDTYVRAPIAESPEARRELAARFAGLAGPTLAVSLTDDEFGTVAAVERLLAYYTRSPRTHLRIAPAQIGEAAIGHFAFFHSRFAATLWPLALAWLRTGVLAEGAPGEVLRRQRVQA